MALHDNCLELGRKYTLKKNHFNRIAVGTNKKDSLQVSFFDSFTERDRTKFCDRLKAAIYKKKLTKYKFKQTGAGSMPQYLRGLITTELTQAPVVQVIYDLIRSQYKHPFTMYICNGIYEVPAEQKKLFIQGHSNEDEPTSGVYNYLVCAIMDNNTKTPIGGFLYPAFDERDCDIDHIDLYGTKIDLGKILQATKCK